MTFFSPGIYFFVLCHLWLVHSSGPTISGPPEVIHPAGENFTLTCTGDEPLFWEYPESEKTTFNEKVERDSSGFRSVLEVSDTDYLATGEYKCYNEESSAQVYVYVPDINNLLAVRDTMLVGYQYHDIVVPCKPTAPEVKVTLMLEDEEVMASGSGVTYLPHSGYHMEVLFSTGSFIFKCTGTLHILDYEATSMAIFHLTVLALLVSSVRRFLLEVKQRQAANQMIPSAYDPKVGFTLSNVSLLDSGELTCVAVKDDIEQRHYIILVVNPFTKVAPKPEIDQTTIQHVVIGQEVEITCHVRVEIGTIFLLNWIFPDMEANKTGRIIVGKITPDDAQNLHHYVWRKTLTIRVATKQDEGNYTCVIVDHNNNTNSDTKYVKVYSQDDTFINLTVHSSRIQVDATSGDVARWIVTLMAHPNAELSWYAPDGIKLSRESYLNSKYVMKTKDFQTTLEIYDVDINDAGNYTVVASNYGGKKILTLELVVYDVPIVKVEYHHYYKIGVERNLTCRVLGYPLPVIQWAFKKCDFIQDQRCEKHSYEIVSRESSVINELQINDSQLESKLKWEMHDPGLLRCVATNLKGSGNDTTVIRVTEVPEGFYVSDPPTEIVVHDNVTLTCGATAYEYKPNLTWYFTRDGADAQEILSEKLIERTSRAYTYWSKINFKKINKTNSGVYKCVAEKASKKPRKDEKTIALNVLDLEPPTIYDTNLTNSEITVSSWQPLSWRCAARGVPTPSIIWFKNDEALSPNSNISNIELFDNNQTLLVKALTMNEEGIYICRAQNKGGTKEVFISLKLKEHHKTNMTLIITVVVVAFLLVVLIFSFIFALWKIREEKKQLRLAGLQNFNKGMTECINQDLTLDEQADLLPYDPKWEFPRSKLKLGKQLGSGAFGVVLKAEAYGIVENEDCTTVAVKMVKRQADSAYIRALASELKILAHLGKHLNVVNLLGACTKNVHKRELLVIVEFCTFGNVHNYLLSHRDIFIDQINLETGEIDPSKGRMVSDYNRSRVNYATLTFPRSINSDPNSALASFDTDTTCLSDLRSGEEETFSNGSNNPDWCANLRGDYLRNNVEALSTSTLVCWAFQIARGMEYLASRRVLHGDLAARNVLLADNNIVKICDFGFAKSIYNNPEYRKSGDGPVPVKWMAIESVTHRIFSTQSDVWSFGIVLWELFSLARTPYPGFENFEIIHNKLIEGYRMEKPLYANQELYDIMLECWDAQPCRRPSFSELVMKLGKLLETNVKEHYIELNELYSKYKIPEDQDYLSMVSPPSYDAPKSHYVNLPSSKSSGTKSPTSDYLDMNPWSISSVESGENAIEMKPMLSEKDRTEDSESNDDYLIPRQATPLKPDCAFNPSYLVSQSKNSSDKNNVTYGKLNKIHKTAEPESETKKNIFNDNKTNGSRFERTQTDKINKIKKNSYVNV